MLSEEEIADLDTEALALLSPAPIISSSAAPNSGTGEQIEDAAFYRLIERIKVGEYLSEACKAEGVSYAAFYDRCRKVKELAEARDAAFEAAEVMRVELAAVRSRDAGSKDEAACARVQADIALRTKEIRVKREAALAGGGKVNIFAGDGSKVMVQWDQPGADGSKPPALPGIQDIDLPAIES